MQHADTISNAWTIVRIALWGTSPTTGQPRAHTRIDFSGNIPDEEATQRAIKFVSERRDYFNTKQYLLNCIDTGNFSIEHTA